MSYLYAKCHKYNIWDGLSRKKNFLSSPSQNSYTSRSDYTFSEFPMLSSLSLLLRPCSNVFAIPLPDPDLSQSAITFTILYQLSLSFFLNCSAVIGVTFNGNGLDLLKSLCRSGMTKLFGTHPCR